MNSTLIFLIIIIFISQSSALTAFATFHLFNPSTPLASCACSDGKNGLITRWRIKDISSLFPYVTSSNLVSWNSPYCGRCIKVTYLKKSIYVTVIDGCGSPPAGYDAHFDLSQEAYLSLRGNIASGHSVVSWSYAASMNCKGNKG